MIEMIIVIVVAGILAAVLLPRFEKDPVLEAAEQVAKHIRYAQHLSMVDDVYDDTDANWYQNRWSIDLCSTQYRVARANDSEIAVDPLSKNPINGATVDMFDLASRFKITTAPLNNANCKITFDNFGRPYLSAGVPSGGPTSNEMTSDTTVTLTNGSQTYTITVTQQTGYTAINY